jgi:cell wall-associated NlpC family hydrolase
MLFVFSVVFCSSARSPQSEIVECLNGNIGKPYEWGGAGPDRFDCSGLAFYCHKIAGITIPRTSTLQSQSGKAIDCAHAGAADLVFFFRPVSHVATFVSNRDVIHSLKKGKPIRQTSNLFQNSYWQPKIHSCRRYWNITAV